MMNHRLNFTNRTLGAVAVAAAGGAAALLFLKPEPGATAAAAAAPLPRPQSPPVVPPKKPLGVDGVPANEIGRIPILMYHSVGDRTGYDRHGLNIRPTTFRKHLQMLHDNGFFPVNARDVLSPRLDVPKGLTPVAITFDDARASQFRYRSDGTVDPDCALGILEAFHKKYGDRWPRRGTFFVLPESKYNPVPFGQAGRDARKFRFLADAGYEIANHSTSHAAMSKLDATRLAWETTFCRDYVKARAPKATMDTLAYPYGVFPRGNLNDVLLAHGNRCLFMAWGDASYAAHDRRFDRKAVMRIGSEPGHIERWIALLARARKAAAPPLRPYVSDGDPSTITVPGSQARHADRTKLAGVRFIVYAEPKAAGKATAAAKRKGSRKRAGD